ncbi:hypothetical protein P280DRAFT_505241 [Massarina eburnea CBS 473.64]|uniref:separase n=1 Tax=Massarina eburnea CBS 473.64 TaxID=1395130 RepID=A0A6A6S5W9_9PLEO|nr:hypothetical protein P280DRAFT_505241 [Massarina eburnea CBS 473.64]
MAKEETRARIDNIKIDLRTISSCTTTTVSELQEVLLQKLPEPTPKENARAKKAGSAPTGRRRAATATASTMDATKPTTPSLTARERYILATEVANTTLKSLAEALKAQSPTRSRPLTKAKPTSDENAQPRPRTTNIKSSSAAPRPLKDRSASQVANSPKKRSALRRSSSYSSCIHTGPDPGLVQTAECSRIAFAYLGTPEAVKFAGKDSPELQLENGMLALIGKLVAHSLDNLAIKEMRMLKRRLDKYIGREDSRPASRTISHNAAPPERESLASLLDFGEVDYSSKALPMIANLQTYALRIIARAKRPRVVEAAWIYLKLTHPSSPANLIGHIARNADSSAKVARQLESLAQIVLQLCPSISASEDDKELQPSPDVVFRLQHLAFKIRQSWWSLASHQGDPEKELLESFAKCMVTYSRRSKQPPEKKYKLAESLYENLLASLRDAEWSQKEDSNSFAMATKVMSSLAQAAGFHEKALRWLGTAKSPKSKSSAVKEASRLALFATVSLEACLKGNANRNTVKTIETALDAICGEMGGSASDLETLFIEVHGLRRMATRLLSTLSSSSEAFLHSLEAACLRAISASTHFTNRFIGVAPSAKADTQSAIRHDERLNMVAKFTKSTVDSILTCCKRPLTAESNWTELDTLIQDCLSLIYRLEKQSPADQTSKPIIEQAAQYAFVKFSNAYWALYSQLRRLSVEPTVSIVALQRSTELLESRELAEQEAGMFTMKLERLGDALDQLDRAEESRDALLQCLQSTCNEDTLQDLVEAAANHPVQLIFESTGKFGVLKRLLNAYHRSIIKYSLIRADELAFFDDSSYSDPARGIILECQLSMYQKTLSKNRPWDSVLSGSVQGIVERLLKLYGPSQFPIRRQRLLLALVQLSQAHPDVVPNSLLQSNLETCDADIVATSEDSKLAHYLAHLKAVWTLKLSLQNDVPQIKTIRECCSAWEGLVNSSTSWKDLSDRIDNMEDLLQEMQACVDFLSAKGQELESLPVLHLLTRVLELQGSSDPSELISTLSTLGLQFLRLGYSGKAGLSFAKAETLLAGRAASTEASLRWHIGYAEYLLTIGNTTKSESILSAAQTVATGDKEFMGLAKSSTTLQGRLRFNRILADACYVSSLHSTQIGNYKDAARHAKQSVVLNRRIWAALETQSNAKKAVSSDQSTSELNGLSKSNFDPLNSMRNDKGVPVVTSVTHDALDGADFWALVPSLYRALMQHSRIFINQGLLQEAVYIAEQADRIAMAIQSPSLLMENASRRAEYWTQSGRPEKAKPILDPLDVSQCDGTRAKISYYSSIARVHHSTRDAEDEFGGFSSNLEDELSVYDSMDKLLAKLTSPTFIKTIDNFGTEVVTLAKDMSAMSIQSAEPHATQSVVTTKGRKPGRRVVAPRVATKPAARAPRKATAKSVATMKRKATTTSVVELPPVTDQCAPLFALQADVTHRKAITLLLQNDITKALQLLDKAEAMKDILDPNSIHAWTRFKATFSQAIKNIEGDFTFNTLPESTIAFPAVPFKDRQSSFGAATKKPAATQSTARSGRGKKQATADFVETLGAARDYLRDAHNMCAATGSNHAFRQLSSALGHVTTLLSAIANGASRGLMGPMYAAYMSEIPKCKTLGLAQDSVEVEQENISREDCLRWPESTLEKSSLSSMADFRKDYVDIIPESWTAVSLALNDEQNELYVTRYESKQDPFVLRLPMARHASRDGDEDEFSFADGKHEFEEIIELSDFSTRSAKDMTTREARVQWWEEREALDTKLKELLINIENIWLGGFKGIFSPHAHDPELLSRFQKSLENILNRHLPSRRKRGQEKELKLNSKVLELFIGLGDDSKEDGELDDALLDLIYFVVDILTFNGERNAYDEIDFDAMAIETLDALRAYHSASNSASPANKHTILILDKNLHMLPWESLPYLEKLSISRLPSLAALRERLLAARPATATPNAHPGHYIQADAGGTSMLNPSGDLSHTLKTIKPRLDDMRGSWNHIVSRAPTEKEFEDSLRDDELVLYFGHGSGAQFVRAKSVRRLYLNNRVDGGVGDGDSDEEKESVMKKPGCATTFLFGCSSVHLSDNGIYEPSGMLAAYLTAGAPAVLGMLWDVTDKDCDRFAVKTGDLWGLWGSTTLAPAGGAGTGGNGGAGRAGRATTPEPLPAAGKKGRGRSRVAQLVEDVEGVGSANGRRRGKKGGVGAGDGGDEVAGTGRGRMGLDEAVAGARGECVLRYLNGAAAVVYGIPVFLE